MIVGKSQASPIHALAIVVTLAMDKKLFKSRGNDATMIILTDIFDSEVLQNGSQSNTEDCGPSLSGNPLI